MDDKSYLFRLDPAANVSYNIYKASKKDGGNFLDFLLKYDSKKANEGDFSSILGKNSDALSSLITNPAINASHLSGSLQNLSQISKLQNFSLSNFFATDSKNSLYDLLTLKADEMVKNALNSIKTKS